MSTVDSTERSTQLYNYLDKCDRQLVEDMKPSQIHTLPQFADIDPRVISEYLRRYKKKHPLLGVEKTVEKVLNSTDEKSEKKDDIITLDKEGYKKYLKKCLSNGDPTPSLLKEFREFLELEGELKQKEAIAHKPDEVRQRLGEMSFT